MAITTDAGVDAGLKPAILVVRAESITMAAGQWFSQFLSVVTNGYPPPAATPTPGLAGATLTSYAGQIPFSNPVSGNSYLASLTVNGTVGLRGTHFVVDRLWHNSGLSVTTTTEQAVNSAAWPARDDDASANGEGVYVGLEVSTTLGAVLNAAASINYTNSAGTVGRAGIVTGAIGQQVGTLFIFGLQAGDTGVRSIQGCTLVTSLTSGAVHLVALRFIAALPYDQIGRIAGLDRVSGGFARLWDNSVLQYVYVVNANGPPQNWSSEVTFAQG